MAKTSVSVLVTGSEVLDGRVLDTNSHFVAEEIANLGLKLENVLSCDDSLEDMQRCLLFLTDKSRFVITSGGLGPTGDDLTREAVARYCGVTLEKRAEAVEHLQNWFAKRGRVLEESNMVQALLPAGSIMIGNPNGTAPGFVSRTTNGSIVCSLSGVPREFTEMFRSSVLPLITSELATVAKRNVVGLKTFGLPESVVGKIVKGMNLPSEVTVSYRAFFPEVHLALKGVMDSSKLLELREEVIQALGRDFVFTTDLAQSFEAKIYQTLLASNKTIATAESCTGGIVAGMLTQESGASSVYRGGVSAYSNDLKVSLLGVQADSLRIHGAVSSEVAQEMANGARQRLGASIGVSITGVAGPDGGSDDKPVGTIFIGVATDSSLFAKGYHYAGPRSTVRRFGAYAALDLVRRTLEGFQIPASLPHIP